MKLKPEIEKQLGETVKKEFNGSYEKFVETALKRHKNVLSKRINISEDLGIEDLAENHDHYLYDGKSWKCFILSVTTVAVLNFLHWKNVVHRGKSTLFQKYI